MKDYQVDIASFTAAAMRRSQGHKVKRHVTRRGFGKSQRQLLDK